MRYFPYIFLLLLFIMAIGDGYLNQPLPLYVRVEGKTYYPFFFPNDTLPTLKLPFHKVAWREQHFSIQIHSPCTYSPTQSESPSFQSPLGTQVFLAQKGENQTLTWKNRHWLGSDENGQDVLSILIHGANISLKITVFSIFLLSIIGIYLGTMAGYFGDEGIRLTGWQLLTGGIALLLSFFYGIYVPFSTFQSVFAYHSLLGLAMISAIAGAALAFISVSVHYAKYLSPRAKSYAFPLDSLIIKLIEIINTLPVLLWVMVVGLYLKGFYSLVGVIVFIGWTGIAQITRLEVMKLRAQNFVEAAQALGLKTWRIIFYHILRNALPPIVSIMLLSISNIILLESSLSFLGIGVTAGENTWGSLLQQTRGSNLDKWWLIFFPTLIITLTIVSLYQISEKMKQKTPKNLE